MQRERVINIRSCLFKGIDEVQSIFHWVVVVQRFEILGGERKEGERRVEDNVCEMNGCFLCEVYACEKMTLERWKRTIVYSMERERERFLVDLGV